MLRLLASQIYAILTQIRLLYPQKAIQSCYPGENSKSFLMSTNIENLLHLILSNEAIIELCQSMCHRELDI